MGKYVCVLIIGDSIQSQAQIHTTYQGGNFHLKVGGAKSSANAGDPMLGVAVSGGYSPKPQGGRWSKIVLLQKDLFYFFIFKDFMSFFPFSEHFQSKS